MSDPQRHQGGPFRRPSAAATPSNPAPIPEPPPLPATPRPFQRVFRVAASRFFSFQSRAPSPEAVLSDRFVLSGIARQASLGASQNATASHKTGCFIHTVAVNEKGTHALIGGSEIFKTVRIEDGVCVEDLNLRAAIRRNPNQPGGRIRQSYSINIADVAWAKGTSGDYVAAATSSGKIILYDLGHHGLPAAQLHEHYRHVHKVTFNPHRGSLLLSGSQDGTVRLWDVRDVTTASTLQSKCISSGASDGVRDVKWSPTDGVDFAFCTDGGTVQTWDMRNLKRPKISLIAHGQTCTALDWHPDGKFVASASIDGSLRVWDMTDPAISHVRRPTRPYWQVNTSQRIMNARWRPTCESAMPDNNGARMSTQLAISYDTKNPFVHIWDLRRPFLPFREWAPHPSAPTDFLWHSQDLLWTVGREGMLLQSDIQHTPKPIDKRPVLATAISQSGDLNIIGQKRHVRGRPRHRRSSLKQRDLSSSRARESSSGAGLSESPQSGGAFLPSRSWGDDSLDHSFLSTKVKKLKTKSSNVNSSTHATMASTSMGSREHGPSRGVQTIRLDDVMNNQASFRPEQLAFQGNVNCLFGEDPLTFEGLAQHLRLDTLELMKREDFIEQFEALIAHNVMVYQRFKSYRTAQSWDILGSVAVRHLRERVASKHEALAGKSDVATLSGRKDTGENNSGGNVTGEYDGIVSRPAPVKMDAESSHKSTSSAVPKGKTNPLSALGQQLASVDLPVPKSPGPSLDDQNTRATSNSIPASTVHAPGGEAQLPSHNVTPRRKPFSLDDALPILPKLEKQDSEEGFAFLATSADSSFPSSLNSNASGHEKAEIVQQRLSRPQLGGIGEKEGTGIRDFGAVEQSASIAIPGSKAKRVEAKMEGTDPPAESVSDRNAQMVNFGLGSYPNEWGITPFEDEQQEFFMPDQEEVPQLASQQVDASLAETAEVLHTGGKPRSPTPPVEPAGEKLLLHLPQDNDPDIEEGKPFPVVEMLNELIKHHVDNFDNQGASFFFLVFAPILPRTHLWPTEEAEKIKIIIADALYEIHTPPGEVNQIIRGPISNLLASGLHPLQVEHTLSSYHDQLMANPSDFTAIAACEIRMLSCPHFPLVWSDGRLEGEDADPCQLLLACGFCGNRSLVNGRCTFSRCTVDRSQPECSFCCCNVSPFGFGGSLMEICLRCGHGGHMGCMMEWWRVDGEAEVPTGACITEGCLCDCRPGARRGEKKAVAKAKVKAEAERVALEKKNRVWVGPGGRERDAMGKLIVKGDEVGVEQSKAVAEAGVLLAKGKGKGKGD